VVTNEARRAACAASPGCDVEVAEAVPQKQGGSAKLWRGKRSRHVTLPVGIAQRLGGPRQCCGWSCEAVRTLHGSIIPHHEVEHMRQKFRVGGGRAQSLRADPVSARNSLSARVAGNEGKCLNRNDFSHFSGIVEQVFSTEMFAFP